MNPRYHIAQIQPGAGPERWYRWTGRLVVEVEKADGAGVVCSLVFPKDRREVKGGDGYSEERLWIQLQELLPVRPLSKRALRLLHALRQ